MAVKILHEEFSTENEIGARARDEARLMSQLNHDNVVQVFGLTTIGSRSAVLMEAVEGIDCGTLMKASAKRGVGLPLRVVARIVECSADALNAAYHAISPQTGRPLHVVHRDIKPGNILVSLNGAVKVMDFGVARADFEREAETKSMQFGTQRYMAPERWLEGEAGPRSDVFSLGLTFAELVTGEKFAQMPLSPRRYAERLDEEVERVLNACQAEGRAAGACEAVFRGMLAYRVENRLSASDASEILAELSEIQAGPSLRRYARKWVPSLLVEREAQLAEDEELTELSGTFYTTEEGTEPVDQDVPLVEPSGVRASRDPRSAKTFYEEPIAPVVQEKSPTIPAVRPSKKARGFLKIALALTAIIGALAIVKLSDGPQESLVEPPPPQEPELVNPCVQSMLEPELPPKKPEYSPPPRPTTKPVVTPVPTVRIKVLADPREGSVRVGDLTANVAEMLTLPEGLHQFSYQGEGWTASCEALIIGEIRKIKFVKETGSCVLLR